MTAPGTDPAAAGTDPAAFYESLVAELAVRRSAVAPEASSFGQDRQMAGAELVDWVCFQAWYEREAASFIGAWLRDVPEEDAFYGLTKQIGDEGTHFHLFHRQLLDLGGSLEGWTPEPEWVDWIQVFYPAGNDTLERVAAHNIAGELGAVQAFETLYPRLPAATQAVLDRVMPDERFHVQLGRMIVQRYATTLDAQARVRARVMGAFEREQLGRIAFERRATATAGRA